MGWQKNMKLISLCIYLFLQREPKQTEKNKKTKNNQSIYVYVRKKTQNCRKRSKTMDYSKLLYIAKNWRDLFAAV